MYDRLRQEINHFYPLAGFAAAVRIVGMARALVSAIIPVHNRAVLCRRAVDSAVGALAGIESEVIVVDDGSDDNLRETLSGCSGEVSVHRIAHCGMPGHARNIGVERSQGDYVAFLDSDDVWHPDKITAQLHTLRESGARMVHCRERWIRGGREISQRRQRHRRCGDIFEDALAKCIVGPSTLVLERTLFTESGGYRGDLEVAEDYELALRLLAFESIAYVEQPLVEKHDHDGPQLSHAYSQIEGFRIRALGDMLADAIEARDDSGNSRSRQPGGLRSVAGRDADIAKVIEAIDAVSAFHGGNVSGRWFPRTRWGAMLPAGLSAPRLAAAVGEYARKCRIFAAGALRRGREREAAIHRLAADTVENVCYIP